MKIRIQDTEHTIDLDVDNVYELSNQDVMDRLKPNFIQSFSKHNIGCSGCGKNIADRNFRVVVHRPQSARSVDSMFKIDQTNNDVILGYQLNVKDIWGLFPFCSDTFQECCNMWKPNRPK